MEITKSNSVVARQALRDILFMYVDLIKSYGGFGHNIETGGFEALAFLDAVVVEPPGYSFDLDAELLHRGSSIAILCGLSDIRDDHDEWQATLCPGWEDEEQRFDKQAQGTWKALQSGRLAHLPADLQRAVALGFEADDDAFRKQLKVVYQEHVVGYFRNLLPS